MRPTKEMQEKIFIKSNHRGYIPTLRTHGPIVTPLKVTRSMAKAMLVSGVDVHEIDPVTKRSKELTLATVFGEKGVNEKKEEVKKESVPKVSVTSEPITPVQLGHLGNPVEKDPESKEKDHNQENTDENPDQVVEKTVEKADDMPADNQEQGTEVETSNTGTSKNNNNQNKKRKK